MKETAVLNKYNTWNTYFVGVLILIFLLLLGVGLYDKNHEEARPKARLFLCGDRWSPATQANNRQFHPELEIPVLEISDVVIDGVDCHFTWVYFTPEKGDRYTTEWDQPVNLPDSIKKEWEESGWTP